MSGRSTPWLAVHVERFADLIAYGATISVAAAKVGRTVNEGRSQLDRMRRQLGAQAI